jgi:hypothetical protein
MNLRRRLRARAVAVVLLLGATVASGSAHAVEAGPGSRNFTAPGSVPNYFSNEAAPFQGEIRAAQPGADQYNAAPGRTTTTAAAPRRHTRKASASAARGKHRGKLVRAKGSSSRQLARAGAAKGGKAALGRTRSAKSKTAAKSMKTTATQPKQAARSTR